MKRPSASLTAKWEARLKSEGMPSELPLSMSRWMGVNYCFSGAEIASSSGSTGPWEKFNNNSGITSSPDYQHWTKLSHAVYALPRNYKGRAFLVVYVETGYFQQACTDTGISRRQGRNILARFAQTMKEQNESNTTD